MPLPTPIDARNKFLALLAQIECMEQSELETFQDLLLNEGLAMGTNRCKNFTAAVHDATINFLDHNRLTASAVPAPYPPTWGWLPTK